MNERHGVTPVISIVLLIGISFFAMLGVYAGISLTQDEAEGALEDRLESERLEEQAEINLEQVYEGPDGDTRLDVRNTGGVALQVREDDSHVFSLYIDGAPAGGDGKEFELVDDEPEELFIDPQERISIDTGDDFPDHDESTRYRVTGPHGVSSAHVCAPLGEDWC